MNNLIFLGIAFLASLLSNAWCFSVEQALKDCADVPTGDIGYYVEFKMPSNFTYFTIKFVSVVSTLATLFKLYDFFMMFVYASAVL